MRPVLAFFIWIVLLGGLSLYMYTRQPVQMGKTYHVQEVGGTFALEITTTFAVEPDPFALQIDPGNKPPALLVKVNGKEVLRVTDRLEPGNPVQVEPVAGLVKGGNEFYLEANPPLNQANQSHAVRVRLLRDAQPILERSFWSERGARISTTFPVDIGAAKSAEEHHHGR